METDMFVIADLAQLRAQDAKTICARKIEAVAKITDQLNHTPEEAAIFKPWCAAMRSHHASLRDAIKAVGDYWNPIQPHDQESLDAKDVGYNSALAAIDIHAGWPEFPGWDATDEPAQLLPPVDALMSDYGPVGTDDITGDLLLDAFEENEAETAAIVQTLSALRLKHLSEQLNVERARLDREHQATGVANPRSASIDRLLGLLTRRGEV